MNRTIKDADREYHLAKVFKTFLDAIDKEVTRMKKRDGKNYMVEFGKPIRENKFTKGVFVSLPAKIIPKKEPKNDS